MVWELSDIESQAVKLLDMLVNVCPPYIVIRVQRNQIASACSITIHYLKVARAYFVRMVPEYAKFVS